MGRYLCFVKGDWSGGLECLAKSNDATLKQLAAKSLAVAEEPAAQVELADAWWDAADKLKGKDKDNLRAAAGYWYGMSVDQLTGLVKTHVEKRLAEAGVVALQKKPSVPPVNILRPGSLENVEPVAISADSETGYLLGAVPRGSVLAVQYVSGKWKSWGGIATENPDAAQPAGGDRCRLAVVEVLPGKGPVVRTLGLVPADTVTKPFVWRADRDYSTLAVRINDTDGEWKNPGSVQYKVRLDKPVSRKAPAVGKSSTGSAAGKLTASNGLAITETLDCAARAYEFNIGPAFDISKGWTLKFELLPPNLDAGLHVLVRAIDAKNKAPAVGIQINGNNLNARLFGEEGDDAIPMLLRPETIGTWVSVVFRYESTTNELFFYVNGKLIKQVAATKTPMAPARLLVGTDGHDVHRFTGQMRNIWLGNEEQLTAPIANVPTPPNAPKPTAEASGIVASTERPDLEMNKWQDFQSAGADLSGDVVRLSNGAAVNTRSNVAGPLDISVTARTDGNDIRLYAHGKSLVIWNWEGNTSELKVRRPDGTGTKGAIVEPLKVNTWYRLRWIIRPTGMDLYVDGKLVFNESQSYELDNTVVKVGCFRSNVELQSFVVNAIAADQQNPAQR